MLVDFYGKLVGKSTTLAWIRWSFYINVEQLSRKQWSLYVRPSKLVTCLNDDGCFEGVPSLATFLASFEAWGIATRHRHAFAK